MMLKPWFKSLDDDKRDSLLTFRRSRLLDAAVRAIFPDDLDATLSLDPIGSGLIRAFIRLHRDAPDETTHRLVAAYTPKFGNGAREFRTSEGTFYWNWKRKVSDADGEYEEMLFLENASKGQCTIEPETVTVTRFKAKCPGDAPVASTDPLAAPLT